MGVDNSACHQIVRSYGFGRYSSSVWLRLLISHGRRFVDRDRQEVFAQS